MTNTETAAALRAQADKLIAQAASVRSKKIRMPMVCEAVSLRQRADNLEKIADFGAALGELDPAGWEPA
jgi:hypothetical protein